MLAVFISGGCASGLPRLVCLLSYFAVGLAKGPPGADGRCEHRGLGSSCPPRRMSSGSPLQWGFPGPGHPGCEAEDGVQHSSAGLDALAPSAQLLGVHAEILGEAAPAEAADLLEAFEALWGKFLRENAVLMGLPSIRTGVGRVLPSRRDWSGSSFLFSFLNRSSKLISSMPLSNRRRMAPRP